MAQHPELQALVQRREPYLAMITQEKNRLETITHSLIRRDIQRHIRLLERRMKECVTQIQAYVSADTSCAEAVAFLSSIVRHLA